MPRLVKSRVRLWPTLAQSRWRLTWLKSRSRYARGATHAASQPGASHVSACVRNGHEHHGCIGRHQSRSGREKATMSYALPSLASDRAIAPPHQLKPRCMSSSRSSVLPSGCMLGQHAEEVLLAPAPAVALAPLGAGHGVARNSRHSVAFERTIGKDGARGDGPKKLPLPLSRATSPSSGRSQAARDSSACCRADTSSTCRWKFLSSFRDFLSESALLRCRKTREVVGSPISGCKKLRRKPSSTSGDANVRAAPAMHTATRGGGVEAAPLQRDAAPAPCERKASE
jgi:hypothetical protein